MDSFNQWFINFHDEIISVQGLFFLSVSIAYLVLAFFSYKRVQKDHEFNKYSDIPDCCLQIFPSICLAIPAFNEAKIIRETVRANLHLNYPDYRLIVVNDGSQDQTLNILIDEFELLPKKVKKFGELTEEDGVTTYLSNKYPKLMVIDQPNRGKAYALNRAIDYSDSEIFCNLDADSVAT